MTMEVPTLNCPKCSKFNELEQLNSILIKSCTDFKNEIEQLKVEKEAFKAEIAKLNAENDALKNLQYSKESQNDDLKTNNLESNDLPTNDLSINIESSDFKPNDLHRIKEEKLTNSHEDQTFFHEEYKCVSCDQLFSQAQSLKMHIQTIHKDQNDYNCVSCGNSFSNAGSLRRHIKSIHEDHIFKCESCGKTLSRADELKRHIHTIHGPKNYKCESCGKSCGNAGSLKMHSQTHKLDHERIKKEKVEDQNIDSSLYGDFVDVSSSQLSKVWKYFKRNKIDQTAKCNKCDKIFANWNGTTGNLKNHIQTKHYITL